MDLSLLNEFKSMLGGVGSQAYFFVAFSMTRPPVLPGVGKKPWQKKEEKYRLFSKGERKVRRF